MMFREPEEIDRKVFNLIKSMYADLTNKIDNMDNKGTTFNLKAFKGISYDMLPPV